MWTRDIGRKIHSGDSAGSDIGNGYLAIKFNGRKYLAHRLAWYFFNGVECTKEIDHINGIRSDNRISNLRSVSHQVNMINMQCHRDGKLVGAYYVKRKKKWRSLISGPHGRESLGYFFSEADAHTAYMKRLETINKELVY